jgi:hypothetical protein
MIEFKNPDGKKVMEMNDEGENKIVDPEYFNEISEENEGKYRVDESGEIKEVESE